MLGEKANRHRAREGLGEEHKGGVGVYLIDDDLDERLPRTGRFERVGDDVC